MATLRCDFFSDVLGLASSMTVVLPQSSATRTGEAATAPPPVLYLLHGLSDDGTSWARNTSIERYAADLGLAVVMPAVARSFYTDEALGLRYRTFLTEELPGLVATFFCVSAEPADTFVAGLSMGGYGAMTWALTRPDRFAAAATLSGVLDIRTIQRRIWDEDPRLLDRVHGAAGPGPDDDPLTLLARAEATSTPPLWVGCGTADELLPDSVAFADAAEARGIEVTRSFGSSAGHTWDLWDREIQRVLAWLPLRA